MKSVSLARLMIALGVTTFSASAALAVPGIDSLFSTGVRWNTSGGARAELSARSPSLRLGPLDFRVATSAAGDDGHAHPAGFGLWNEARAEWPGARASGWLGVAWPSRAGFEGSAPVFGIGGWTHAHNVTVLGSVRHRVAQIPQPARWITTWPPDHEQQWPSTWTSWSSVLPFFMPIDARPIPITVIEPTVRWSRATLDVDAGTGLALGAGIAPMRWARAEARWWVKPRLAMSVGATGPTPSWLATDLAHPSRVQLGLRFEPGRAAAIEAEARGAEQRPNASSWRVVPLDSRHVELRLLAPGAHRVELRGDVTGWEATTLTRGGGGWWTSVFAAEPGMHQIEIRIDDGAWQPPPGVPTTTGAYGEAVGVIFTR
jgi:hypothetical protein